MHSDAKLNLRSRVGSCVEPLSGGVLGAWWASGVAQCSSVFLELLVLLIIFWWLISCGVAAALGGLEVVLTAALHLVPVGQEGAGEGLGCWGSQRAEGAHLAVCTGCCATKGTGLGLLCTSWVFCMGTLVLKIGPGLS